MQLGIDHPRRALPLRSRVKEVLAKANPPKSGDDLAGVSARDAVERVAARAVLAEITLAELRANPVVPYEQDELTRAGRGRPRRGGVRAVAHLDRRAVPRVAARCRDDRADAARGRAGPDARDGRRRVQADVELRPDDGRLEVPGRRARELDARPARQAVVALPAEPSDRRRRGHPARRCARGSSYGCGDAVIGVNPATDTPESTAEILRAIDGVLRAQRDPDAALRALARHRADEGARRSAARWT